MPMIEKLTAQELAQHAFNVFLFNERHVTGAKLLYRALELDPHNPDALRSMSDFFDTEATRPLSAAILEYALDGDAQLTPDQRREFVELRFVALWHWGFTRHISGQTSLAKADFINRAAFITDETRYRTFLDQAIRPAGSLPATFHVAHTLCGFMGGLLKHKTLGKNATIEAANCPENFDKTPDYLLWLAADTAELEALEKERLKRMEKKPRWKFW